MMDDKKIEEVAKVYMIGEFYDRDEAEWNYPITNEEKRNQCIIDFKAGAKWAAPDVMFVGLQALFQSVVIKVILARLM